MQILSYLAVMYRNGPRDYAAWFPDLPDCFAGGESRDVLELHAHKTLLRLAETAVSAGRQLPPPRTMVAVRADPGVQKAMRAGATIISILLVRE
jgi:predicted RNase H-like HicB family nuclease